MDWADEPFVKLYTRDTPEWVALGWHAQALLMQIFRKVDRAGVLVLGKLGPRAVAVVLHVPELWESLIAPALDRLVADGCVCIHGDRLIVPNFLPAQQARMSDKLRQQEFRARRRSDAMSGEASVTKRDRESQNVTDGHVPYSKRNGRSHGVTTRLDKTSPDPDPRLSPGLFPTLPLVASGSPDPDPTTAGSSYPRKAADNAARAVTDHWTRRYTERTGGPPTWKRPQHFANLKRLLTQHGGDPAVVIARIDVLFDAPPRFLAGSTPDFDTLVQHFDKLAAPAREPNRVVGSGKAMSPDELAAWSRARMEAERKAGLR